MGDAREANHKINITSAGRMFEAGRGRGYQTHAAARASTSDLRRGTDERGPEFRGSPRVRPRALQAPATKSATPPMTNSSRCSVVSSKCETQIAATTNPSFPDRPRARETLNTRARFHRACQHGESGLNRFEKSPSAGPTRPARSSPGLAPVRHARLRQARHQIGPTTGPAQTDDFPQSVKRIADCVASPSRRRPTTPGMNAAPQQLLLAIVFFSSDTSLR